MMQKTLELGDIILTHEFGPDEWFLVDSQGVNGSFRLKQLNDIRCYWVSESRMGMHFGLRDDCIYCMNQPRSPTLSIKPARLKPATWSYAPYVRQFQEMEYVNHSIHWIQDPDDATRSLYRPCQQCFIANLEDPHALNHKLYIDRLVKGIINVYAFCRV